MTPGGYHFPCRPEATTPPPCPHSPAPTTHLRRGRKKTASEKSLSYFATGKVCQVPKRSPTSGHFTEWECAISSRIGLSQPSGCRRGTSGHRAGTSGCCRGTSGWSRGTRGHRRGTKGCRRRTRGTRRGTKGCRRRTKGSRASTKGRRRHSKGARRWSKGAHGAKRSPLHYARRPLIFRSRSRRLMRAMSCTRSGWTRKSRRWSMPIRWR